MNLENLENLATIQRLAGELILDHGEPPPPPPPPPDGTQRVTTALEFMRAGERGGKILVAPGTYALNLELFKTTSIVKTVGSPSLLASASALEWANNVVELTPERSISYPTSTRRINPGQLAALLDGNHKMLDGSAGYSGTVGVPK